jgi:hypothetical protein
MAANVAWIGRTALVLAPILELLFMDLDVELHHARLQAFLCVGNALVVDQRTDLLQEERQQSTGGNVADGFVHVLLEIALDRGDGLLARFP